MRLLGGWAATTYAVIVGASIVMSSASLLLPVDLLPTLSATILVGRLVGAAAFVLVVIALSDYTRATWLPVRLLLLIAGVLVALGFSAAALGRQQMDASLGF